MKGLLLWVVEALASDDEGALDLSTLGEDVFNPYITERHALLVFLPVLGVLLVLWHLMRIKRKRTIKEWEDFQHAKTSNTGSAAGSHGESSGG